MCGRFTLRTPANLLVEEFRLKSNPQLQLRFNIAPTQMVAVVRISPDDGSRNLDMLRWGLVPPWAKDPIIGPRLINARAETAAEKPSFRGAFRRRRCLIPADGYYEWKREGSKKRPYYFRLRNQQLFAFAGLWESWGNREKKPTIETCTILTTKPNALAEQIHDRMPVILESDDYETWLDPNVTDRERVQPLLHSLDADRMIAEPVSSFVNNARNEGAQCIEVQRTLL